jgi:hypothetical protein
MGKHDAYGKRLVRRAAGVENVHSGVLSRVDLGGAGYAHIDCTICQQIAVEVESRTSKQVRGAVLDLIVHPYRKKLLLLLPAHMNAAKTKIQCEFLLSRCIAQQDFRVVACDGTGTSPKHASDTKKVKRAIEELRASLPLQPESCSPRPLVRSPLS